jgi:hypothetical protein
MKQILVASVCLLALCGQGHAQEWGETPMWCALGNVAACARMKQIEAKEKTKQVECSNNGVPVDCDAETPEQLREMQKKLDEKER